MRPFFEHVRLNCRKGGLVGAEIGVAGGDNAEDVIKHLSLDKIYLVDHYQPYYGAPLAEGQYNTHQAAKDRLKFAKDKIEWIIKPSEEASIDVPGESLDFVYIDANHHEEGISSDINVWLPKVKPYGFIGGHDFDSLEDNYAVMRVVSDFAIHKNNYKITVDGNDWWIQK